MKHPQFRLAAVTALVLASFNASALPFNSFDPRSMAMGGAGVAVDEPATAPFFNPALLSADDGHKKYSIEMPVVGVRLFDPGSMRTNGQVVKDNADLLSQSVTPLTNSTNTLATNTTTLSGNIATLNTNTAALAGITLANIGTASTALATVSGNMGTVATDMTTVSGNMTTVSSNSTTVQTNLDKVNASLQTINNKPVQGEFGAAMVVGVPGPNLGVAFYGNAWGAVGGALEYKDAANLTNNSNQLGIISTAFTSSATATRNGSTALTTAQPSVNQASTDCAANLITTLAGANACLTSLTTAQSALNTANTTLSATNTTVTADKGKIQTATTTISNNKQLTSQVHLRGVAVGEMGFSLSHGFVTADHTWALGVTPKVMQLTLFDALIDLNSGTNNTSSNATGNDNIATYTAFNADLGVAKSYSNGWRTGFVVKNIVPQTYEFKRALTSGATPVATGATLNLNPQARIGVSRENAWSTVALDIDLTQNNPAGMESKSQYVALGGEISAWGWAQLRAGYRADLVNNDRSIASLGLGISPRIPYFKLHTDLAVAGNANEAGASIRLGMNF